MGYFQLFLSLSILPLLRTFNRWENTRRAELDRFYELDEEKLWWLAVASSRRRRRFCSRESNSKAIENHNFSPSFKALFYSLSKNAVLTSAENHFQWFVDDMVVAEEPSDDNYKRI